MILAGKRPVSDREHRHRETEDDSSYDWRGDGYAEDLVTGLTPSMINRMERDELIDVLRSVPLPFLRSESLGRLQHWDVATLRRAVHLACRCHQPQYY